MTSLGCASPRVGLLGNPSDGYGGRVVSFAFADFFAQVVAEDAGELELGPTDAVRSLGDPAQAILAPDPRRAGDGAALLLAALRRFVAHAGVAPQDPRCRMRMTFVSDIPRQVGLSGSSAIIIAALRALGDRFAHPIDPYALAMLAWAAETTELGITAGPQDRVIQAYGGLLHMDFRTCEPAGVRVLDPGLLPPLFVAFDPRPGRDSGAVHADVRGRWLRGDPEVRRAMDEFAELADQGLDCLLRGDRAGLGACMTRNFALRSQLFRLTPRECELVEIGRAAGAAVKFAGSGGAVVGTIDADDHYMRLCAAYGARGYRMLRPTPAPGLAQEQCR